jgi:hypothetical protein
VGCNLLPIFGFNFVKCLTFHTSKLQLITRVERCSRKTAPPPQGCARATAATWSKELPFVLLELRAQLREDTGLSPAEAVFGSQIVLPNEFLQNDKLSVDTIVKKISKSLHVSAPSLPRHNSSTDLPSELPAELPSPPSSGSDAASWFYPFSRSTTAPTWSCATAPAPSPSESGRGTRLSPSASLRPAQWGMPHLTARVTAADCWARAQVILSQPSRSCSQTRWSLHLLLLRRRHVMVPEMFSNPARRFLYARDRWRLHSLHRRGTRLVNGQSPGGWTSDLFSSQLRPEFRGSPLESWLHPWRPSGQLDVLHHRCKVPVYKLLFIRQ